MQSDLLSIIIPDRNGQPYLSKTIDDILAKAGGNIEIIVVMDGVWADPPLKYDKRVKIIHHGTVHNNLGMRESINRGIAISKGKYIMKCDEHVMFDKDFDLKLKIDCEENWVVIPRRYRLDPDNWKIQEDGRAPVDYMFIAYPYERPYDETCGMHGDWDRQRAIDRKDILIDDVMTGQGSCYFMHRSFWDRVIKRMDSDLYGTFTQEAQEITMKAWLSGGRVVVNKKTWYAHMHKGKRGKGYGFSNAQYAAHQADKEKGRLACIDYWLNNRWPGAVFDFEWLLKKFWPIPTWPENWKERIEVDKLKDFSTLKHESISK